VRFLLGLFVVGLLAQSVDAQTATSPALDPADVEAFLDDAWTTTLRRDGVVPGAAGRSSSSSMVRPAIGDTRKRSKRSPLTQEPSNRTGSPPPTRFAEYAVNAAMSAKDAFSAVHPRADGHAGIRA